MPPLVGALRIALVAEGAGELARNAHLAPGELIPDDALGPGHVLVRRIAARTTTLAEAAIRFVAGLRRSTGQQLVGSGLTDPALLKEVLIWPQARRAPTVTVVLIDADGNPKRAKAIEALARNVPIPATVILAVQEFEAWLLADDDCVQKVMRTAVTLDKRPDDLTRGLAKKRLATWCHEHRESADAVRVRVELAATMSLERGQRRSRSLKRAVKLLSGLFDAVRAGT